MGVCNFIALTSRQYNILRLILRETSAISINEISIRLDLSKRQISYDLPIIENWLRIRNTALEKKPGRGIYILADVKTKDLLLRSLSERSETWVIPTPSERITIIEFLLLISDEPVVIEHLSELLCISRSTIINDLKNVEISLERFNLTLIKQPGLGLSIVGLATSRIEAIIDLIVRSSGVLPILSLCDGSINKYITQMNGKVALSRIILNHLQINDIQFCASLVNSAQVLLDNKFSDESYVTLVLHLMFQINRIKSGKKIKVEKKDNYLKATKVAEMISKKIKKFYGLTYPSEELYYLTMVLSVAGSRKSINDIMGDSAIITQSNETEEIVEDLLDLVSEKIHPYLKVDAELRRSLLFHLEPALSRIKLGLNFHNPYINDLKQVYSNVYYVANQAGQIIERKVGKLVPDEEIGFLTMHFAAAIERLRHFPGNRKKVLVVCSSGVATAWLLVSRLRIELPYLDVTEVLSAKDLQTYRLADKAIVAIITTVPIERKDIPVILVSPLLRFGDIEKINEIVGPIDKTKNISGIDISTKFPTILDLLNRGNIAAKINAKNWEVAVDRAIGLLILSGNVENNFLDAVKNIIIDRGPYMVIRPGIALLHGPPSVGVRRLSLGLITLRTPVPFGHKEYDPVDLIFTLGAVDGLKHLQVLSDLMKIMDSANTVNEIRNADCKEQIFGALQNYFKSP